jgi:hypothetical protein
MAWGHGHTHRVYTGGFFGDDDLDFVTRIMLGQCAYGAADAGEVLATIGEVEDQAGWAKAWSALATRLEDEACQRAEDGTQASASSLYLRASGAWATATAGLVGEKESDPLLEAFRSDRRCWDGFVETSDGRHVPFEVPYEGTTLPAWLLRPDATGAARPTLVMTNGSDGALAHLWGSGAAEALARGWNALVYDGPGQQSMLFERDVPFRPDWEHVLTPVVDALVTRPDVDEGRLYAYAISQGGYWLPRALAFEHRFVAAAADPGVVDVATSWLDHMSKGMVTMLDEGKREQFNRDMRLAEKLPSVGRTLRFRSRPYGQQDEFDTFTEVRRYDLTSVAGQVRTPLWISDPEDEQFWPGQPARLASLVPTSHLQHFTAAEGASLHCQPLARRLTHERMFDWFAEQAGSAG